MPKKMFTDNEKDDEEIKVKKPKKEQRKKPRKSSKVDEDLPKEKKRKKQNRIPRFSDKSTKKKPYKRKTKSKTKSTSKQGQKQRTKRKSPLTHEQRSEIAKKGWETRRKNQQKLAEQKQKELEQKESENTETDIENVPEKSDFVLQNLRALISMAFNTTVAYEFERIIDINIATYGYDDYAEAIEENSDVLFEIDRPLFSSDNWEEIKPNAIAAIELVNIGIFSPDDIERIREAYHKDNEVKRNYYASYDSYYA